MHTIKHHSQKNDDGKSISFFANWKCQYTNNNATQFNVIKIENMLSFVVFYIIRYSKKFLKCVYIILHPEPSNNKKLPYKTFLQ